MVGDSSRKRASGRRDFLKSTPQRMPQFMFYHPECRNFWPPPRRRPELNIAKE